MLHMHAANDKQQLQWQHGGASGSAYASEARAATRSSATSSGQVMLTVNPLVNPGCGGQFGTAAASPYNVRAKGIMV